MQRISNIFATFFIAGLGLVGCSNPVDSTANNIPLRADAVDDAADVSATTAGCDCLKVGDMYRFTTLQLTSVDGNPDFAVIPVLNSLWQSDINTFELNFVVKVTGLTADTVDVEVTNGARVGATEKPCLLPDTMAPLHFPRAGCTLSNSAVGTMNVYAGSQQHTKNCGYLDQKTMAPNPALGVNHSIPIRGAVLKATVSNDCSTIDNGIVVAGSFSKDALFRLCTCQTLPGQNSDVCTTPDPTYKDMVSNPPGACDGCGNGWQSLGGLLSAFAGDAGLQYGCVSDTGAKSVCLTATFAAKKLDPAVWLPSPCSPTN